MAYPKSNKVVIARGESAVGQTPICRDYRPQYQLRYEEDFLFHRSSGPAPASELYVSHATDEIVTLYHAWMLVTFKGAFYFKTVNKDIMGEENDRWITVLNRCLYEGGWVDQLYLVGPLLNLRGQLAARGAWGFDAHPRPDNASRID